MTSAAPDRGDLRERHLAGLASFLNEPQRGRLVTLAQLGRRERLVSYLAHLERHRTDRFHRLDARLAAPDALLGALRRLGAPEECYVLSERADLDDRFLTLDLALAHVVNSGSGTILSCIPAKLAYFEGEEAGARYLLLG